MTAMGKICGMTYNPRQQVDALKKQVICDFQDLLHLIQRGHRPDYEQIIQKISLIDIAENYGGMKKLDYYTTYYNSLQWIKTVKLY